MKYHDNPANLLHYFQIYDGGDIEQIPIHAGGPLKWKEIFVCKQARK